MKRSELEYSLPEELIAQHPAERRDESRLLVYERATGRRSPCSFRELPEELGGELVVVNDTRVVPARLRLERPGGGAAEVLLLEPLNGAGEWEGLARPTRKLRPGPAPGPGRADRASRRGPLAPASRGRPGRRGAAAALHHRAARRSRSATRPSTPSTRARPRRRRPASTSRPSSWRSSTSSASRSTSAWTPSGRSRSTTSTTTRSTRSATRSCRDAGSGSARPTACSPSARRPCGCSSRSRCGAPLEGGPTCSSRPASSSGDDAL